MTKDILFEWRDFIQLQLLQETLYQTIVLQEGQEIIFYKTGNKYGANLTALILSQYSQQISASI